MEVEAAVEAIEDLSCQLEECSKSALEVSGNISSLLEESNIRAVEAELEEESSGAIEDAERDPRQITEAGIDLEGSANGMLRDVHPYDIPCKDAAEAARVLSVESAERLNTSGIAGPQLVLGYTLEGPLRTLGKMKWKARARSKPSSPALSGPDITPAVTSVSTKSQVVHQPPKCHRTLLPRVSQSPSLTVSLVPHNGTLVSSPPSPCSVLEGLHGQPLQTCARPQQSLRLPYTPVPVALSLSHADPEAIPNTPVSCPIVQSGTEEQSSAASYESEHEETPDMAHGTLNQPLHAAPFAHRISADAGTDSPIESEEDMIQHSVGYSPQNKRCRLAARSSKPPRPAGKPPLHPSTVRAIKHSIPHDSSISSTIKSYKRQVCYNERQSSSESQLTSDSQEQQSSCPLQTLSPLTRHSAGGLQPVSSATRPVYNSPVPWLVPPDMAGVSTSVKLSNGAEATTEQKHGQQKRTLHRLQNEVSKKLKTWGLQSHLLQEGEGDGDDQSRLVIGEEERDDFVKKMVESCRRDPQMRTRFLDSVRQLSDFGVLQTSACHLAAQGPCDSSQELVRAWKEMVARPQDRCARVEVYNAVDKLHNEGEAAVQKLPWLLRASMCSLDKTSDGSWEVVIPVVNPGASKRKRLP